MEAQGTTRPKKAKINKSLRKAMLIPSFDCLGSITLACVILKVSILLTVSKSIFGADSENDTHFSQSDQVFNLRPIVGGKI